MDDHDAPGLFLLPDGRYIAMYSNHGNTAMGDYLSRYRISTNPHDATSWSAGADIQLADGDRLERCAQRE